MFNKTIDLDLAKKKILLDTIREFAENRDYEVREEVNGPKHQLVVYDRKPESSFLVSSLEMFAGSSLLPDRVRLESKITELEDKLGVSVLGEVMMKGSNYVNRRPSKRDTLRCKDIFEAFFQKISSI